MEATEIITEIFKYHIGGNAPPYKQMKREVKNLAKETGLSIFELHQEVIELKIYERNEQILEGYFDY